MGVGAIVLVCAVGFAKPPELVELAPPPRLAGLPVAFVAVKGGYQILLNRWAADRLQAALDRTDEKQVAAALRDLAKEKKEAPEPDEEGAAKEEEESGSSSYVAPEKEKDTQLQYALGLLRGTKTANSEPKKKAEAN